MSWVVEKVGSIARKYKPDWLSSQADKVRRQLRGERGAAPVIHKVKNRVQVWLRGKAGLPIVLLVVFVVIALLTLLLQSVRLPWDTNHSELLGFLNTMWQVHAGILGVTFVVVVLLIQSTSSKWEDEGLFRLYVEQSWIVPMAYFGLSLVIVFGAATFWAARDTVGDSWMNGLANSSIALFPLFVISTAWLYWKTVQYLRPEAVRVSRLQLAQRAIEDSIDREVEHRIQQAMLRQRADHLGLLFPLFAFGARPDLSPVRTPAHGIVADIDLRQLERFAQKLVTTPARDANGHAYRAFLLKGIGDRLSDGDDVLARVFQADSSEETAELLRRAFKVVRSLPTEDLLADQVGLLKDQAFESIRSRRPAEFDRIVDTYSDFFEKILAAMNAYGIAFTPSAAGSVFPNEWRPLFRLSRDLHDIVEFALATEATDLIQKALYAPVQAMAVALKYNDHLLFQKMVRFSPSAYVLGSANPQERVREMVTDLCWRYLSEFMNYRLVPEMERDSTTAERLGHLAAYARSLVLTFNALLKASTDHGDVGAFKQFGEALDRLLERFRPDNVVPEYYALFPVLDDLVREADAARRDARRQLYERLHLAESELEATRQAVWFGLGGWLIHQFQRQAIKPEAFESMFSIVRAHFGDLASLSHIAFAVLGREPDLDWDSWELAQLPEGRAHFINTGAWLIAFYCVQGLRLTPSQIDPTGTPIPPDGQIRHLVDSLTETCQSIQQNPSHWAGIVPESDVARIDGFLEFHRRARSLQLRKEEDWLIAQELSAQKIAGFEQQFLEAWREGSVVRTLITHYGSFVDDTRQSPPPGLPRHMLHVLEEKAVFVEDWPVVYQGWGKLHGGTVAADEDRFIVSVLEEALPEVEPFSGTVGDRLLDSIQMLRRQGYSPNVILIEWGRESRRAIWQSPHFLGRGRPGCPEVEVPGFAGTLDGVCLAEIARREGVALVMDLKRLGKLVQYRPNGTDGDVFEFEIDPIDQQEAERLCRDDPSTRFYPGTTQQMTEEETVRVLQQKVHLIIAQRFQYIIDDPQAGIKVSVIRQEANVEGDSSGGTPEGTSVTIDGNHGS